MKKGRACTSPPAREDQGAMVIATERRRGGSEQKSQRVLRKASSFRSGYTRAQARSLEAVRARTRREVRVHQMCASSNGLLRQAGVSVAMQKTAIGGLTRGCNYAKRCTRL